jgi:MOSC domain-containing protein YiiM
MTTLAQDDLPADPGILRAIARHNRVNLGSYGALPCVGVYASVVQSGVVRRGDAIRFA